MSNWFIENKLTFASLFDYLIWDVKSPTFDLNSLNAHIEFKYLMDSTEVFLLSESNWLIGDIFHKPFCSFELFLFHILSLSSVYKLVARRGSRWFLGPIF